MPCPHPATIPPHSSIVYCPRTHAAFGHPPHPFRDFLARGVRVALGTDSLASNPDLDLLAEARFVHLKVRTASVTRACRLLFTARNFSCNLLLIRRIWCQTR